MKSYWLFVIGYWVKRKKPLLPRGWDILSQVVLGASCSKFWEAKEEAASSSSVFCLLPQEGSSRHGG
jgi:hypothetical protein